MREFILVITTLDDKDKAKIIARKLVEEDYAACVQILGPGESVYRWRGKVEEAKEWLLFIKTTSERYKGLETLIKRLHPYEVPEIIALPIIDGNEDYLRWIVDEIGDA